MKPSKIAAIIAAAPAAGTWHNGPTFTVSVNYDLSTDEAVETGNYDWKNTDITSDYFPATRKGTANVTIHLAHFNRDVSSKTVIAELDANVLRPAEIHELLALGAAHPEIQQQFPIAALGSICRRCGGYDFVPYLDLDVSGRFLSLDYLYIGWGRHYRFAAILK